MSHVLITGASAGIGAAIAHRLADGPHRLSLGARRVDRLEQLDLPESSPRFIHALDVTNEASIDTFLAGARAEHGPVDILINNAGLARGLEPVAAATGEAWREMIETNLVGVLNMTRRILPAMVERRSGHVVFIGSVAGRSTYEGASVYCATKRALQSLVEGIRYETLGSCVRVTSIDPGLVETEFAAVRFSGDTERAATVYAGTRPLTAEDVAACVTFAIGCPPHVNIESMLVMPTDQASPSRLHRQ